VIVEGAYPEFDMATKWCIDRIGPTDETNNWKEIKSKTGDYEPIQFVKNGHWSNLWFDKIGYDYGFSEFYFKEDKDLRAFTEALPSFYGTGPKGRWKTEGYEKFIDFQ